MSKRLLVCLLHHKKNSLAISDAELITVGVNGFLRTRLGKRVQVVHRLGGVMTCARRQELNVRNKESNQDA